MSITEARLVVWSAVTRQPAPSAQQGGQVTDAISVEQAARLAPKWAAVEVRHVREDAAGGQLASSWLKRGI